MAGPALSLVGLAGLLVSATGCAVITLRPTPADVPREDFYLCVAALVPYKRIDLAIRACNRLGRKLVVIGDGPERADLARLAGPTVELLGWCSDEGIRRHLRCCRALLFPGNWSTGRGMYGPCHLSTGWMSKRSSSAQIPMGWRRRMISWKATMSFP